ncbi:MAG: chemotaxis protein CheW [Candidatus Hodarchaeales archaeon]|jgi:purine-binding chemotaxis protein CheW
MKSSPHTPQKYLVFQIVKDVYGIKIDYIKEVFQTDKILKLPKTSQVLSGITELRGYILSVFDLSVLLWGAQLDRQAEKKNGKYDVLVVTIKGQDIGILVDQVNQILKIRSFTEADQSKFKGKELVDESLITQIGVLDDQSDVFIVDPEKVIGNYFTVVKTSEKIQIQEDTDDMDFDFSQYTLPDEGS